MKLNKIISCIIALTMIISMFSCVCVSASTLDGLTLTYTPSTTLNGNADGTITISGITTELQSTITNIDLYWGKNATAKLENYYNIANYTVEGFTAANKDYDATLLEYDGNGSISYTFKDNRLIPEGATHIIADVITADATTKQLSVEIPDANKFSANKSDMLYNMVWASDYHAVNSSIRSGSEQRKGVEDFVRLAAIGREAGADKFKGVIFNGDISNSSIGYEYAVIEQIIEENNVDFPIYYTTGNHDTAVTVSSVVYDVSDEAKKALGVRFDKLENQFGLTFDHSDPWSYETYIGGHHYILLSSPYVTNYTFSDAQAKWLEEKLCYDEKSGIPTFIFTHIPFISINGNSVDASGSKLEEIVARHPSAVVISSHVHFELDQDRNAYTISNGTPVIDTSAITYTNTGKSVDGRGGYCRYLEFYPDRIIMRARNVKTQTWVAKAEHIIYVDDYGKTIAEDFEITKTGTAGTIAEGDVLTAKLGGSALDTSAYSINWYDMSGALVQEGGDTYTVTAAYAGASISAKITRASDGAYAWAVARHGSWVSEFDDGSGDGESSLPSDSVEFTNETTIKYYDDVVFLSGSVDASYAGKEATMVLIPKATYPDLSTAKYIGYCTIADTGAYTFKFKANNVSDGDMFLIKVDDAAVAASNVVQKAAGEELVEITTVNVDDDGTVSFQLKNKYVDTTNAKIIVATYDGEDNLIKATPVSYEIAFGENGEIVDYISEAGVADLTGTSYVRIFLWSSLTEIRPLSNDNTVYTGSVETVTE